MLLRLGAPDVLRLLDRSSDTARRCRGPPEVRERNRLAPEEGSQDSGAHRHHRLRFHRGGLLLFAGDRVRGGLHALRHPGDLRRVAVAQLLHRRVARLARRLLYAHPEVALAFPGLGRELHRRRRVERQPFGADDPLLEVAGPCRVALRIPPRGRQGPIGQGAVRGPWRPGQVVGGGVVWFGAVPVDGDRAVAERHRHLQILHRVDVALRVGVVHAGRTVEDRRQLCDCPGGRQVELAHGRRQHRLPAGGRRGPGRRRRCRCGRC